MTTTRFRYSASFSDAMGIVKDLKNDVIYHVRPDKDRDVLENCPQLRSKGQDARAANQFQTPKGQIVPRTTSTLLRRPAGKVVQTRPKRCPWNP